MDGPNPSSHRDIDRGDPLPTRSHQPTPRYAARSPRTSTTDQCVCGKVRAHDLDHARRLYCEASWRNGEFSRVRFYECDWNGWHWTRSPVRAGVTGSAAPELVIPGAPRGDGRSRRRRRSRSSRAR